MAAPCDENYKDNGRFCPPFPLLGDSTPSPPTPPPPPPGFIHFLNGKSTFHRPLSKKNTKTHNKWWGESAQYPNYNWLMANKLGTMILGRRSWAFVLHFWPKIPPKSWKFLILKACFEEKINFRGGGGLSMLHFLGFRDQNQNSFSAKKLEKWLDIIGV